MQEFLQPRTDAGVAVQVGLAVVLVMAAAWRVRRSPDLLRLVLGGGVFLGGLFMLRAMH